jgi:hypothetical protein
MSFDEFCEHMKGYRGKNGLDFQKKVAQDNTTGFQNNQHQPMRYNQHQPMRNNQMQPMQINQMQPSQYNHVNANTGANRVSISKNKAIIGGVLLIAVIIAAVFIFQGVGGRGGPLNSSNAVNEIQNFTPVLLSGLTLGEMFNGASADGSWTTYEVTDNRTTETWVRFVGSSARGAINATFTLNRDRMLVYTCYVGGNPTVLDELYRMFHDPNYDRDMSAAADSTENQARFDETEARILRMALVHNYSVDDFEGMTVLEFIDSISTSGDWSINERTENLRVVFDGHSDRGAVQAIFDVDENAGTVDGSWYFNSREIEAADLYREFYP